MNITIQAIELLDDLMKKNDATCILVNEIPACCGTQLSFSLARPEAGEKVELIEGIPFLLDVSGPDRMDKVSIQVKDNQLLIEDGFEGASTC